jgi:Ca2+-binding RTX toxin-like protein
MTGGDGADTFVFGAAGAGAAVDLKADGTIDATGPHYGSHTYYQEITDFTVGDDLIDVGSAVAKTDVSVLKTTFASVADAQLAASADTHAVVATQVGGDTYLFWHGGDDVVKLDHVTAANLDYTSFTH